MSGMKMQDMPYDLHFIDMMVMHHHQGIDMAKLVDGRSTNPKVKAFAAKTSEAQQKDLDELRSLRDRWYADKPVMDMSQMHNMPDMKMDMKMDMEGEMAKLRAAKGAAFDRMFLDMMIHHHQMALNMSKEAITKAEHAEIKEFARRGLTQQQAELAEITKLRAPARRTTKAKPKPKTTTNETITQTPGKLELWFNEELQSQFNSVVVTDESGRRVDKNNISLAEVNKKVEIGLEDLADGKYTVTWKVLSADKLSIIRWIEYVAMMSLFGGFIFQLLIARPSVRKADGLLDADQTAVLQSSMRRFTRSSWVGIAVLAVGVVTALIVQTSMVLDVGLVQAFVPSNLFLVLFKTGFGGPWFLQAMMLVVVAIIILMFPRWRRPWLLWAGVVVMTVMFLAVSLMGHAGAIAMEWRSAAISDWLHLVFAGDNGKSNFIGVWVDDCCFSP